MELSDIDIARQVRGLDVVGVAFVYVEATTSHIFCPPSEWTTTIFECVDAITWDNEMESNQGSLGYLRRRGGQKGRVKHRGSPRMPFERPGGMTARELGTSTTVPSLPDDQLFS